jgi:hypothetical protein
MDQELLTDCKQKVVLNGSHVMFFSSILYVAFVSGPKCTCLHFDVLNFNSQSFDHYTSLSISFCKDALSSSLLNEEKDLGITIGGKLKFQQHINLQTKKANQRLGMIKRSFCNMDKEMFLPLYIIAQVFYILY